MKFHETHFEEYINTINMHPKLEKVLSHLPDKIQQFKNLIFYGPSGVGKYTQMLRSIKQYSPSELKYEKKISVMYNKQQYFFKISDIHYEVDMSLLGCSSKLLWHEIYQQIVDIVGGKTEKYGIIVCKYFHEIHNELLENFYSYMQRNPMSSIDLKFIIITENISFLPENILNCCEVISLPRPSKAIYTKCLNLNAKVLKKMNAEEITNVKNLHNPETNELMQTHRIISDKILTCIKNIDDIKFVKFRDLLYDVLIYNLDVNECVWYILSTLINEEMIPAEKISETLIKTYTFFKYYNNNYRPIYHMENYFFYLISLQIKV
jgi:hypothetical protein